MYLVFSLAHADLLEVETTIHALCLSPLEPGSLKPLGGELSRQPGEVGQRVCLCSDADQAPLDVGYTSC